jgi:ubiquinone/menaquinone biosynthesis C-methylase UbiE
MNSMSLENRWSNRFDAREALYTGESGLNYWEARAGDFSEMRVSKQYEYGKKILAVLEPLLPANAWVLDIGAGPGSLLVPFGPKVKQFTAIEPAVNMVAELRRNAEKAGIENYEVLQVPWQDVDTDRFRSRFDLVMISITLWMFRDIWRQILRMEQVCKGYCCVITGADQDPDGHGPSLWKKITGDIPKPSYTEFPFIFNLLYANGRRPEVRTFSHRAERSVESRIRQQKLFYAKYVNLTPSHEAAIEDFVEKTATNGMVQETYTSAVVWWKPAL